MVFTEPLPVIAAVLKPFVHSPINETLALLSVPGMRESIGEGMRESIGDCASRLDW